MCCREGWSVSDYVGAGRHKHNNSSRICPSGYVNSLLHSPCHKRAFSMGQ